MIKTSNLLKRIWIVAISVIAITLMSVAVSFATEAEETAADNVKTQNQPAFTEEVVAGDETFIDEEVAIDDGVLEAEQSSLVDNAEPLHVNVKFTDPNVKMWIDHRIGKELKEYYEYDPSVGITFSDSSATFDELRILKNGRMGLNISYGKLMSESETYKFKILACNDNLDVYIKSIDIDSSTNTVTAVCSKFTSFNITFHLFDQEHMQGLENYYVTYYTADGNIHSVIKSGEKGIGEITGLDKASANGYFYIYDKNEGKCAFEGVNEYMMAKQTNEEVGEANISIELEDVVMLLTGNEHHSNFIYNRITGNGENCICSNISYVFKEFVGPASVLSNPTEAPELFIDDTGSLSVSIKDITDLDIELSFTPVAEDGYVWDNWDILGKTYGPNSEIDISKLEIEDIFTAQANYKAIEAPENTEATAIAQTSDATPFAGIVAVVAAIAGVVLISLRKNYFKISSF